MPPPPSSLSSSSAPAVPSFLVYASGNNTSSVKLALERWGWRALDVDKSADTWLANVVWKPTWKNERAGPLRL